MRQFCRLSLRHRIIVSVALGLSFVLLVLGYVVLWAPPAEYRRRLPPTAGTRTIPQGAKVFDAVSLADTGVSFRRPAAGDG